MEINNINNEIRTDMKKISLALFTLMLFAFSACSDDDSEKDKKVNVGFYLTDAPAVGDIEAVYLDMKSVSYSLEGDNWISLAIKPSSVELLQFSNGKDSLLSNITLDAGIKVQQIRLLLGENNFIIKDGTKIPLKTPSGQTSGFKINVQSIPVITSGYKVVVDFNAAQSIVAQGNGNYSLKPVIRAYIQANTSAIYGYLTPDNEATRVFTLNTEGDTISTISDINNKNYFQLHGLFSGTYKVQTQNLVTSEFGVLKDNVIVLGGTNVDLGTISLP